LRINETKKEGQIMGYDNRYTDELLELILEYRKEIRELKLEAKKKYVGYEEVSLGNGEQSYFMKSEYQETVNKSGEEPIKVMIVLDTLKEVREFNRHCEVNKIPIKAIVNSVESLRGFRSGSHRPSLLIVSSRKPYSEEESKWMSRDVDQALDENNLVIDNRWSL
jgi:hypothetical protein